MVQILTPGQPNSGYLKKEPTKAERMMFELYRSQQNMDLMLMNLQNNLIALKTLSKVTDKQMEAELKRMGEEAAAKANQQAEVPGISPATRATVEKLAAETA